MRAFEGVEDGSSGFSPAFVEAAADTTCGADVGGVDGDEADVGSPVRERVGAAEREDDEGFGGVDGEEACYVCFTGAWGGVSVSRCCLSERLIR